MVFRFGLRSSYVAKPRLSNSKSSNAAREVAKPGFLKGFGQVKMTGFLIRSKSGRNERQSLQTRKSLVDGLRSGSQAAL
jgi:hypothetical protein